MKTKMKKWIFIQLLMVLGVLSVHAQDDSVDAFLGKYKALVSDVWAKDSVTEAEQRAFTLRYDSLTAQYHEKYKAMMNDQQMSRYTEYRTRYHKRFARQRANELGQQIDSVGDKVFKGVKKTSVKVGGFLKGIFRKE